MCVLNGTLRPVAVRDRSVDAEVPSAEKADRTNPNHIAAPFAGVVSRQWVSVTSWPPVPRSAPSRR